MIGKEIEFKYSAKNVSVTEFLALCYKKLKKHSFLVVDGVDHFFSSESDKHAFFRFRSDKNNRQLTYKKKLNLIDNFIRTEHNIDINSKHTLTDISAFMESIGYKYNTIIKKRSYIFTTPKFVAVYYICFDYKNQEIGRFIELELSEEVNWQSNKNAIKSLRTIEKRFMLLGIGPKERLKLSLWEMFKKKN